MRVRTRDRGAVALMVGVSLVAMIGFTAISVDIGNGWQQRRELVGASDAAALAAAQEYASGGAGCDAVAIDYVARNAPDAVFESCTPSAGAINGDISGSVAVEIERTVEYFFAPLIGMDSTDIGSATVAQYGLPIALGGLRPFGLCEETLMVTPEYTAWAAGDMENPSAIARVFYNKSAPTHCNLGEPVPGNWAMFDLNGGANSNSETADWVQWGFDDIIGRGWYDGDTGAFSQTLSGELNYLIDEEIIFGVPLFDQAMGNGSNVTLNITNFVAVQLHDFKGNGPQSGRYLDLQFHKAVLGGQCCDDTGTDMGVRVVGICATEATDPTACAG